VIFCCDDVRIWSSHLFIAGKCRSDPSQPIQGHCSAPRTFNFLYGPILRKSSRETNYIYFSEGFSSPGGLIHHISLGHIQHRRLRVMSAEAVKPHILLLAIDKEEFFDEMYEKLLTELKKRANTPK